MILDETSVGMVYRHAPGINTGINCEHINASNKDPTSLVGAKPILVLASKGVNVIRALYQFYTRLDIRYIPASCQPKIWL